MSNEPLYNYDDLNKTELVALALRDGFLGGLHRGMSREDLIAVLEGTLDPEELPPDPVNADRDAMIMMQENYPSVMRQLYCEILSNEEGALHPCWDCPAARAVNCSKINCDPILMEQVKEGKYRGQW